MTFPKTDKAAIEQYWGEAGLERTTTCIACGGPNLAPFHTGLNDLLGNLPGEWGFLKCLACASLSLDPHPTPKSISKAYPTHYVTHGEGSSAHARDNGSGVIWKACNGYLNQRFGAKRSPSSPTLAGLLHLVPPVRQQLDYFFRHLPNTPGTLLDVGCGNGAFLLRAKKAGWAVQGLEPDIDAVGAADGSGIDVVNSSIADFDPVSKFDQITLSHVVEHLHHPSQSLEKILTWLKPGGKIWLALPNPNSLGHRFFGRNWFSLDPPRHLCIPSQQQMQEMLRNAGFVNVQLMRRGRGSRSSICPSLRYARIRTGRINPLTGLAAPAIDFLSSFHAAFSEETIMTGHRSI